MEGAPNVILDPEIVPPVGEPAPPKAARWQAGTLIYTAGGLVALFCWLLWGDFAYTLKERSVPPTLQLLLRRYGASDALVGLLLGTLPALTVILISPIVSYKSDRHRGRRGRRIPFLLVTTPIAVAMMAGLAYGPSIGNYLAAHSGFWRLQANGATLLTFSVFWTIFEVCTVISQLVFMALCNDVVPPAMVGRFFGLFRMVGLAAGMIFNFSLLSRAESHYRGIFFGMGALYGIGFSLMCLRVKEGEPPAAVADSQAVGLASGISVYARECFGLGYYRWLFLSIALASMSFAPINLFSLYFAKALHMDLGFYGKAATLQLCVSAAQAYPLGWLADRIHPLRLTIISLVLFSSTTLLAFFFVRTANLFAVSTVVCGACAGFWLTANGPMCMVLLPKAKYAQFSGAISVCSYIGILIVGYVSGKSLDLAGHDYRYIYLWAAVLSGAALLATLEVYRRFETMGGVARYQPPECHASSGGY